MSPPPTGVAVPRAEPNCGVGRRCAVLPARCSSALLLSASLGFGCGAFTSAGLLGCLNLILESYHRMAWIAKVLKHHPVPTHCYVQGCQPADQAAQSRIQPGLECLQGWGIHSLLGQPVQCITVLLILLCSAATLLPAVNHVGICLQNPSPSLAFNRLVVRKRHKKKNHQSKDNLKLESADRDWRVLLFSYCFHISHAPLI